MYINENNLQIKLFILIWCVSFLLFNVCNNNSTQSNLGTEFIESQTDIGLIDTFSVDLSTIILDEVLTSGTGNLLIGNYRDANLGKITSHTYFQLGVPT